MVDTAVGDASASTPARDAGLLERALFEVKRVIVGQNRMVERMRRGPSNARVDDVAVGDAEPGSAGRFELRR